MRFWLLFIVIITIYSHSFSQNQITLTINEVSLKSESQWIEIYNYGDEPVRLESLYFSDTEQNYLKWEVKNTGILQPKSYEVIYLDSGSRKLHIDTNRISSEYLYFYAKNKNRNIYIDHVKFRKGNRDYCKYPDGVGNLRTTNHTTPGSKNNLRTFLTLNLSPNTAIGFANTTFNQTQYEYETKPGMYLSSGLDVDVYLWERYRFLIGANVRKFNYSYYTDSRLEKSNYYVLNRTDGYDKSTWLDFKIPLLYNSFRVYDHFFVDIGFLMSIKLNQEIAYDQSRSYYTHSDSLLSKASLSTSNDEFNGEYFIFPFVLKTSYRYKGFDFFAQYQMRKSDFIGNEGNDKNLQYSFSIGANYNLRVLRFKGF